MVNKVDNSRFESVRFKNLQDIINYFEESPNFHSIIIDLDLDDSQGLETLLSLIDKTEKPIIVYSIEDNIELGYNALQVGAIDFILKSKINYRILLLALQKASEHNINLERIYDFQKKLDKEVKARTQKLNRENQMLKAEIQQRKTLDILKAAEKERLSGTLKSIADGVLVTETDGKIILLNKTAEKILGYSQKEVLKKSITEIFKIKNEEFPKEGDLLNNLMDKEHPYISPETIILVTKNQKEKFIQLSIASVRSIGKEVSGLVFVFRDQTDQIKQEAEHEKNYRLETVGQMASGLAHEMNNILTMILSNIDFIHFNLKEEQKIELQSFFKEIDLASNRAKNLIQQLMIFTMGGEPAKQKTDLGKLIHEICFKIFSNTKHQYQIDILGNLNYVEIDIAQFSQAFANVLKNAIEASEPDKIITITLKDEEDSVLLEIQDQGKGIHKKALKRIFDPYFSLKKGHKGLGLTTAYSIIKSHSGTIKAESKQNKGTTIKIKLPAIQGEIEDLTNNIAAEIREINPSFNILLVDDEQQILDITNEFLTQLGFDLETAKNPREAKEKFREALKTKPFDLLLIDLDLNNEISGENLFTELKELDDSFKAILISGHQLDKKEADYIDLGFYAILEKPYRIQDLITTIKQIL